MTKQQLTTWFKYIKALEKPQTYDNFMEIEDRQELIRLNYQVMEMANKIHNENMLGINK